MSSVTADQEEEEMTRFAPTRRLLLGGAALALPGIHVVAAQAPARLTVALGYAPNVEMFGPLYAWKNNFYAAEGLQVTTVPATTSVDQVQMVAAGRADIGIVGPEQIIAGAGRGEKFKIFAAQYQRSPVCMTARRDSGITTPAQLPGRPIAVKIPAQTFFELFMRKNGLRPDQVTVTPIGRTDVATIISGRVHAMITTFAFNEPRSIEMAGVPVTLLPLAQYGMNAQTNSYFVQNRAFADPAKREILVRYLRAESKAWEEYFKDPAAAARWIVDQKFIDGLDVDQQIHLARGQAEHMKSALTAERGLMWLDPAIYRETATNLQLSGVTQSVIDTDSMLSTEILERAGMPKI
jgi:NitT/TauT family transport system substrate-binding protein